MMLRHVSGCPRALARLSGVASLPRCSAPSSAALSAASVRWASSAAAVATNDAPAAPAGPSTGKKVVKIDGRTVRKEFILNRMDHVFSSSKMIAVLQHNSLNVDQLARCVRQCISFFSITRAPCEGHRRAFYMSSL